MPRAIDNIKPLTFTCNYVYSIKRSLEYNTIEVLPNITHLKITIGIRHSITRTPFIIVRSKHNNSTTLSNYD
ncbi:unnamed protein product [Adineta ricciae]|uniref:Uncharacterized protein n=1 Tax=Adineta ricciae TaxID=249248 RepID=A0A814MVW9_ADIRI|nr:unnamed protein product [Adineta ricciae]